MGGASGSVVAEMGASGEAPHLKKSGQQNSFKLAPKGRRACEAGIGPASQERSDGIADALPPTTTPPPAYHSPAQGVRGG